MILLYISFTVSQLHLFNYLIHFYCSFLWTCAYIFYNFFFWNFCQSLFQFLFTFHFILTWKFYYLHPLPKCNYWSFYLFFLFFFSFCFFCHFSFFWSSYISEVIFKLVDSKICSQACIQRLRLEFIQLFLEAWRSDRLGLVIEIQIFDKILIEI